MLINRFIIIFCLLWCTAVVSQSKIDSLKVELSNSTEDSTHIDLFLKLYYAYHRSDQNKALFYATKAEDIALNSKLKYRLATARTRKAQSLKSLGNYEESEQVYKQALDIFIAENKAIDIAKLKVDIAHLYQLQSRFEEAITLYVEALDANKKLDNKNTEARIHNYLGSLYKFLKQPEKAIENYEKALELVRELNFDRGISACLSNLGTIYFELENDAKALEYLNEAYIIKKKTNDDLGSSRVLNNIALVYANNKSYIKAEQHFNQAYNLAKKVNNPRQASIVEYSFAKNSYDQSQFDKSEKQLNNILIRKDSANNLGIEISTHKLLAFIFEKRNNYKKALIHSKALIALVDSLHADKIQLATNEIEAKYQNKEKAKELDLLTAKSNLQNLKLTKRTNERNATVIFGIFVLAMAIMFYYMFIIKRKTNLKLRELDESKSAFFANISHEFRTPLTLILGPINRLLSKDKINKEHKEDYQLIETNANRLLALVDRLLDISKIEAGRLKLNITNYSVLPFIGTLADGFTFLANEKSLRFKSHIEDSNQEVWTDKLVVEKIVLNLISNAIKYTPENGIIEFKTNLDNEHLEISVTNSGEGLTEKQIEHLFERFYQTDDNHEGFGLGLSLVKELVALHHGSISVNSKPNEWTTFKVKLPTSIESFSKIEFAETKKKQSIALENFKHNDDDHFVDSDKSLILIVDDNKDVRLHLDNIFKNNYNIIFAKDGIEGLECAAKFIPEVIISDVMMPKLNGVEMSKKLKLDEKTCHIPIILLTAKAGEENLMEGIESGADDYITKPFKNEHLLLKVRNLLESRKRLRALYSKDMIELPEGLKANSLDSKFLNRIKTVFDKKLIETSFGPNELGKSIGMSRMQLHRKLKALTGLNTSEFIRVQRLKLAAKLLEQSNANVSEIGYSVGFNNHPYFSKSFKEYFKCTPSEYAKKAH